MRKHGASDEDALYESPNHRPAEMGERAALRQHGDVDGEGNPMTPTQA